MTPNNFLSNKRECSCRNTYKRLKKKDFFANLDETNYDYSKFKFTTARTASTIICKKCGKEFNQTPYSHIIEKHGCPYCAGVTNNDKLQKLIETFPEYDFSKAKYINNKTKITVVCPKHGDFFVKPNDLNSGVKCPICAKIIGADKIRITKEEFLERASQLHGDKYNYSKVLDFTTIRDFVTIICPKHGEFAQRVYSHLQGAGCPICCSSKGELKIGEILKKKNIQFFTEYIFVDCKDKRPLPFDFYLPELNIAIEYQGKQHYEAIEYFGGEKQLYKQQKHDKIKKDYCKEKGINLLEIKYNDDIEEVLKEWLF